MQTVAIRPEQARAARISDFAEQAEPIPATSHLLHALEQFRRYPRLRFLAVVDDRGRPIGALHEQLIRDLLFNPFGYALLTNPGCPWRLEAMVCPCPVADVDAPIETLVAVHANGGAAEGVILTQDGAYAGLLPSQSILRLAADREQLAQARRLAEAEWLRAAVDRFRADAANFGTDLDRAAAEMRTFAAGAATRAVQNDRQATAVAAASRQSADAIAEVAVSSSELARQGKLIEARTEEAAASVNEAVVHVAFNSEKARTLALAADEIGGMITAISEIAAQVNLLAINARIEAVRAGSGGNSFSVVANEVKALAGKAGAAARTIEKQIGGMRQAVSESAAANAAIEKVVQALAGIATSIRQAVVEQSIATEQIADNVEQCAIASGEISSNIADMSQRVSQAGDMAARLEGIAEGLVQRATALAASVDTFLAEVRTTG
jgi:methyl-accepting chemotaxis protein